MNPRTPRVTPHDGLFRTRVDNLISPRTPVVLLAPRSDRGRLNEEFGAVYEDVAVGQPAQAGDKALAMLR